MEKKLLPESGQSAPVGSRCWSQFNFKAIYVLKQKRMTENSSTYDLLQLADSILNDDSICDDKRFKKNGKRVKKPKEKGVTSSTEDPQPKVVSRLRKVTRKASSAPEAIKASLTPNDTSPAEYTDIATVPLT